MKRTLAIALLAAMAIPGYAETVVFDTFNEADPTTLFDCCNALPIVGSHNDTGRQAIAVPFSPEVFSKIHEVDVAISGPGNDVKISIAGSTMGLPGKLKKTWVRDGYTFGQCCQFAAMTSGQTTHAAGGGHYWIVIEGQSRSIAGWNLNSAGLSGAYAVRGDDMVWTMTEGPLPAVRVIAR
jgi:hypothetical protein